MKLSHGWSRAEPAFDEVNLVSFAGLVPVMGLAERAGLSELIEGRVTLTSTRVKSAACNPGGKLSAIIAGMAATRPLSLAEGDVAGARAGVGIPWLLAWAAHADGRVARAEGRAAAQDAHHRALTVCVRHRYAGRAAEVLECLASLATVGESWAEAARLYKGGKAIGRFGGTCTTPPKTPGVPADQTCFLDAILPGGQLYFEVIDASKHLSSGKKFYVGIIGGTGRYRGARGDGTIAVPADVENQTDAYMVFHGIG